MNEITDERLKEISFGVLSQPMTVETEKDMAEELLSLRQRVAELEQERHAWQEDAERLFPLACNLVDNILKLSSRTIGKRKIAKHIALVDKYKKA